MATLVQSDINLVILRDTQRLVDTYVHNKRFRDAFIRLAHDPIKKATYRGRPLKFYINYINSISPEFSKQYFNRNYTRIVDSLGKGERGDFFFRFMRLGEYEKMVAKQHIFSEEEQKELEKIEAIDKNEKERKYRAFEQFLQNKETQQSGGGGIPPAEETQTDLTSKNKQENTSPPTVNTYPVTQKAEKIRLQNESNSYPKATASSGIPKITTQIPTTPPIQETITPLSPPRQNILQVSKNALNSSASKNVQTFIEIQAKKLISKIATPERLATITSAGIGAIVGFQAGGPVGALGGVAVGSVLPVVIKQGMGETILGAAGRVGGGAVGGGGNLISVAATVTPVGRAVVAGRYFLPILIACVVGFIVLFVMMPGTGNGLLETTAVLNTTGILASANTENPSSTNIGGNGCPSQTQIDQNKQSPATCQYLNPSFDLFGDLTDQQINDFINQNYATFGNKSEFTNRVNYIVSKARQVQLNPVIFLGYWKTESAFSTVGSRDLGCSGNGFYEQVDCATGISSGGAWPAKCASPVNPQRQYWCDQLKQLRASHPEVYSSLPINYPISTIDDFAEAYGSKAPNLDGPGTVNNNCTHTYNQLLEVISQTHSCQQSAPTIPPNGPLPTPSSDIKELRDQIASRFNVQFDDVIVDRYPQILNWMWKSFTNAQVKAPQYFMKVHQVDPVIYIKLINGTSQRQGNTIYIGPQSINSGETFIRHLITHELGHIIHGYRGQSSYDTTTSNIVAQEGFISSYSAGALPDNPICEIQPLKGGPINSTRLDEDFAESVSYYINSDIPEQNISYSCAQTAGRANPIWSGQYPLHLQFIKSILNP